ncbi:MAG TPA: polysaccharide biosynthesis tyrosine autokinase [Candidatus Omnitrophota bacterium]|nr:polysaccharide biosynthesis tyrosine autokinase [Candidatus Omnitrophota bacterium]
MLPSPQTRDVTIKDYLIVFKRRLWVIIACFVITFSWSAYKTFKKIPMYSTYAKILVERSTPVVSPVQQYYVQPTYADKEFIQSQINVLTSRTLAKKVVENIAASGDMSFSGYPEPEGPFLGGVSVIPLVGTQIISVGYISTDPVRAARYANFLTNTYIQLDKEKRAEVGKSAAGWLDTQLVEARKKLKSSEDALNAYVQTNSIISLSDVEQRSQGALDSFKAEKANLENELADLSKRYKSKHPKYVSAVTRIESLKVDIEDETKKLLEMNNKLIQYNALKREMESDKTLFESLLRRSKETDVSKDVQSTNLRIIDLATVPVVPFTPNRQGDMRTGAMIGLFLGIGLAFILEYLDSTIKTAEDIEIYVKLPFLGYVPGAKLEMKGRETKDIDLVCLRLPSSRIAEAFRSIRTSIIFSSPEDRPLKTILVTSTSPREGKTTVSINLATVFANANEKTLLIEADMRRPRISHSLGAENKAGLSSYLAGTAPLEECIEQTQTVNLFLLQGGPKPPNPAELLSSTRARMLLADLKTKFDRIIIDSPPILTVADTSILANIVDGVIDVIMANFLNIDIILRSRQRLFEAKAKIIGVVLNNVNVRKEDSYYYYHYYYADDKGKKS